MKNLMWVVLLCILVPGMLGACGEVPVTEPVATATAEPTEVPPTMTPVPTPVREGEFVVYEAEAYTLEYPAAWQVVDRTSVNTILFVAPETASGDLFRENVGVTHQDLADESTTVEAYTDEFLALAPEAVMDYELVSSEATTLAGLPAHRVVYAGSQNTVPLQWLQVWTVANGRAYIVTYTADPVEFEQFVDEANAIISSFTLQ